MKKQIMTLLAMLCLVACSNPSGPSSLDPNEAEKMENREEVGIGGELPFNYKPQNLKQKVFEKDGFVYSAMDFESQNLAYRFDASEKTVKAKSRILFRVEKTGRPYFQFAGAFTSARLNGRAVDLISVSDPDGLKNTYHAVDQSVDANDYSILEVEFTLPSTSINFENGGIGFMTDMTDLSPGEFFESWGPANFEEDQFAMVVKFEIINSTSKHQVFANGSVQKLGKYEWQITFPAHYTSSSFFMHLTNRALKVKNFAVTGKEKTIPVTVYASTDKLVSDAVGQLPGLFAELEKDYGPYPHASFVAYMHSGGGGMEYVGATITSLGALDHELFHSWFARGMMPAEGRSGWIDEAMASWRDYGYFQATSLLSRPPTVLAAFSPYRKSTPSNCYKDGRHLISELDVHLASFGGMKALMKGFVQRYKYRVVTTEELIAYLEQKTQMSLAPYFQRYLFGNSGTVASQSLPELSQDDMLAQVMDSKHPTPLTENELKSLR